MRLACAVIVAVVSGACAAGAPLADYPAPCPGLEPPGHLPPEFLNPDVPPPEGVTAPAILNRREIVRAMEREYPPLLRDDGISGTVRVGLLVNAFGIPVDRKLERSSGYSQLDQAALRVAEVYRFRPSTLNGCSVGNWVVFPLTFAVR